ncbi:hypothetical protein EZS27_042478, partial [termite gut metagenome]
MITIKDITGASVEVTDLDAAIRQCRLCKDSPYKMASCPIAISYAVSPTTKVSCGLEFVFSRIDSAMSGAGFLFFTS